MKRRFIDRARVFVGDLALVVLPEEMALFARSKGLRRLLAGPLSNLQPPPASRFSLACNSSSSPLFDDDGGSGASNAPPLTMPKLFVSGLSRMTTDEKLREAFSPFGRLLEAKVITDRVTGRSKGFGFVRYATVEEASSAREGMNAKFLDGWVIFVDPAKPREPRPPPPPPSSSPQASEGEAGFRANKTIGWCG